MSYKINLTDGTLLVDLVDGRIDQETTDLTLVGRNYSGYGEFWNENFVKLLENFKNVAAPANPLTGQLWYDTSEGRLKVYTGTEFKATDTTVVSATQPTLLAGDIWIDSARKQIYFSDGTSVILAGPAYTQDQGATGLDTITLVDRFGVRKTVSRLLIGGATVAIISRETFIAANVSANLSFLDGFSLTVKAGININTNYSDFEFYGTADNTRQLSDNLGNLYEPDDFLQVSRNNVTTGTLHVKNDLGLIVGDDSDFITRVQGTTVIQRAQLSGSNYRLQITQSSSPVDAITITNSQSRIGLWNSNPQYNLDVVGNVKIAGNLIIEGETTSVDATNLRVEDKQIELAITSDSTLLSDIELNNSGIVVKGAVSDKTLLWDNTYDSWNSSTHFNIPSGFAYKIGSTNVLTSTTLASSVTSATGLTEVGTLSYLNVDTINLNNSTITTSTPLTISSNGDVTFSGSPKILGVASPDVSDSPDHVATKGYVDNSYLDRDIWLTLDITGLSNGQIASIIEDLVPALTKNSGAYAYVHCVSYSGSYTYNGNDGVSKTFVSVDSNGVQNQSVVADFSFSDVTDTVTLTITRSLKRFIVNGASTWIFESELTSSV
jgi:hypothetical protein